MMTCARAPIFLAAIVLGVLSLLPAASPLPAQHQDPNSNGAKVILPDLNKPTPRRLRPRTVVLRPLTNFPETIEFHRGRYRETPTHFSFEGRWKDMHLGSSIAAAGDLDRNGVDDVLVGAQNAPEKGLGVGGVFVLSGSDGGLHMSNYTFLAGVNVDSAFGSSVAAVGDVNGDRFSDVLIGAPLGKPQFTHQGQCFFVWGQADPRKISLGPAINGRDRLGRFGNSVCGLGDMDHDGFCDFVIGARTASHRFRAEGAVMFFRGGPQMLTNGPTWQVTGGAQTAHFGTAVANAGDVNGDGFNDLLVGAPEYSISNRTYGRVLLYFGSIAGPSTNASWIANGPYESCRFGIAVSGIGDLNQDGYADFAVGAPGGTNLTDFGGMAFVYLGGSNGPAAGPSWAIRATNLFSLCGRSVAGVGDVNGDGWPDVLIGSPLANGKEVDEGCVALYLSSASGLEAEPSWVIYGGQRNARYGWEIAGVGDVNHDGFSDFAVATPYYDVLEQNVGRVDIYYGSPTNYDRIPAGPGQHALVLNATDSFGYTNTTPRTNGLTLANSRASTRPTSITVILTAVPLVLVALWWGIRAQRLATEQERARVARDLHDGLGSRLAQLSQSTAPPSSATADQAVQNKNSIPHPLARELDEIVWALNPGNDTLEHLVSFLGESGQAYFERSPVRFRPHLPFDVPSRKLPSEVRRDIAMIVKEAFANVLRHSQATEVILRVTFDASSMLVVVEDNGIGLAASPPTASAEGRLGGGNGWKNMQARATSLRGSCTRETRTEGGTRVTVRFPLPR